MGMFDFIKKDRKPERPAAAATPGKPMDAFQGLRTFGFDLELGGPFDLSEEFREAVSGLRPPAGASFAVMRGYRIIVTAFDQGSAERCRKAVLDAMGAFMERTFVAGLPAEDARIAEALPSALRAAKLDPSLKVRIRKDALSVTAASADAARAAGKRVLDELASRLGQAASPSGLGSADATMMMSEPATRASELGRSLGGRAPEDTPMNCASCGYSFLVDERAALARGRLGACPECGADSILLERR